MEGFWLGYVAAFGTIAGVALVAALGLVVVAIFGRSQSMTLGCAVCDKEWECKSLWQEWSRDMLLTRHIRREHSDRADKQ